MGAFLDRLTAFGQPLTIVAVLMRIGVAVVIGAVIGIEREIKNRPAGMRTHVLVCVGAALVSLIESQTVADVVALGNASIGVSMGRITTSVVSGVGFLGAGMIFVRNQTISGLTTAAGVWATAGIGMTIGAGLYFLGVAATLLIVAAQMTLHKNFTWLNFPVAEQISMEIEDTGDGVASIRDKLLSHNLEIISMKSRNNGNGLISLDLYVKLPRNYNVTQLMSLLSDNPHIKSIDL